LRIFRTIDRDGVAQEEQQVTERTADLVVRTEFQMADIESLDPQAPSLTEAEA